MVDVFDVTLNPSDMGSGNILSNGNLTVVNTVSATSVRATHGRSNSRKCYFEVKFDAGAINLGIGIANKTLSMTANILTNTNQRSMYGSNGFKYPEGLAYTSVFVIGDTVGVLVDLDNGFLEFRKNNVSLGVSHTDIKILGEVYPFIFFGTATSKTATFNFGASPFAYPLPVGYYSYDGKQANASKFLISSEDERLSIFTEKKSNNTSIPIMTSDTSPSGRAFAKDMYGTAYPPWKAFNGIDDNEGYVSLNGSGGVGYLGYDFLEAISLYKYAVRSPNSNHLNKMPKNWTFEGSNDGSLWTVLDGQIDQTWITAYTDKEYLLDVSFRNMKFKMYRLNWTANNGYSFYTDVNELKMFETIITKLIKVPSLSESDFNKYGMGKDVEINLYDYVTSISDINSSSELLGSGKVFKQKIDRSKHKAHKII